MALDVTLLDSSYAIAFGRGATSEERMYWMQQWEDELTIEGLVESHMVRLASEDGADELWRMVRCSYQASVGRDPHAEELSYWIDEVRVAPQAHTYTDLVTYLKDMHNDVGPHSLAPVSHRTKGPPGNKGINSPPVSSADSAKNWDVYPLTDPKQETIREYARRFGLRTLIETGTYMGDMVHAMKGHFDRIVSIELGADLYERARRRFARDDHIRIVHGDSSVVLAAVLSLLESPCLFWLDGHYSGGVTARGLVETPVMLELAHILDHQVAGHVILIDDSHEYTGRNGYPSIDEMTHVVTGRRPDWTVAVKNGIVIIHGQGTVTREFVGAQALATGAGV